MEEGMLYKRLNGGSQVNKILVICLILSLSGSVFGAAVILNEYNAVTGSEFLGGGSASADDDDGRASDTYFGRIQGNGGDWFELVVITDHLNMQGWQLDIYNGGGPYNPDSPNETLTLTSHSIWDDLRSGTIITVSEDVPSDISYDPAGGDWWINVQAKDLGDGLYITASNFPVSNQDWQLRIRNSVPATIFGPAGEGVSPEEGVSDIEIFRLETDPCASIAASSTDYDDGKDFSTFGSPNQWGRQDFGDLRTVVPTPTGLTLYSPNGTEIIMGGSTHQITWGSTGTIDSVLIEFSIDYGDTWSPVYPPNVGNTGSYNWLVPDIDSEQCIVRITNATNFNVSDTSHGPFFIYQCLLQGDLTDDCVIDLLDVAVMASAWLGCGDPHNPACP